MSPTNRDESGYARPQAGPYAVLSGTSGPLLKTIRWSVYPSAYARGTRLFRQPVIHERSFGPLYQLVSILIAVDCLNAESRAPSASGPRPNSRRGDAGTGVALGVGVGVLVAGAPEPAGPAPSPTNFATSPQLSVAVKKIVVGSPGWSFRISKAHVRG